MSHKPLQNIDIGIPYQILILRSQINPHYFSNCFCVNFVKVRFLDTVYENILA